MSFESHKFGALSQLLGYYGMRVFSADSGDSSLK